VSTVVDLFIEEARAVTVLEAAQMLGIRHANSEPLTPYRNYAGPCPACGGNDRFSINTRINAFNCRQCDGKGRDGIALMALAGHHNVATRGGLLAACADALGKPVPDEDERETEEDRAARLQRIVDRKRRNEEQAAQNEIRQNEFREREINQARGIYLAAQDDTDGMVSDYLLRRTGFKAVPEVFANLRYAARLTYWHGKDDRGYPAERYCGPAMVAPIVNLDCRIIGCHQTWIDIGREPKFRPELGADEKGEPLPTKKMRGVKKGGLVPIFGLMTATRWVGGEGIENGMAIAGAEGFREDTFYFAAGDIGNLAGPADAKSNFKHPSIKRTDTRGRERAVTIQGPEPRADQGTDDAMQVPEHVESLVLLADGDSEIVFTAAAMARAEKRMAREGRRVTTIWPPEGRDFADCMTGK
jgi:hypothetical protein